MPVNYSRGGMSSLGYQLSKSRKITGFGKRRYGRGDEPVEVIEPPKRNRGRPRKNVEPEIEESEDELLASRSRGRPAKTHQFTSNIVETLNNLMGQLALEERAVKDREIDTELKQEELKRLRAMQRQISKAYLQYV